MDYNFEQIKKLTVEEVLNIILNNSNTLKEKSTRTQSLYDCIFNPNEVDYQTLMKLLPELNDDEISIILKYDKDYKISFLLSIANVADEEDMTKQAIYLLKRHGLKYIIPLLPYVDEDEIREEYIKLSKR